MILKKESNEKDFYNVLLGLNKVNVDFDKELFSLVLGEKFRDKYNLNYTSLKLSIEEFVSLSDDFDKELIGEWLVRIKHAKVNSEREIEFKCKLPNTIKYSWVRLVLVKTSDELCYGALIDIDTNNRIIQDLKKDKHELEMILDNTTALIAKYNVDGELLHASKSYKEIDDNLTLIHSSKNWYKYVLKPPYKTKEIINYIQNGVEKWLSFHNNAIFVDGKIDHILSTACDITKSYKRNMKLSYESQHDLSTGLFNRLGIKRKIGNLKTLDNVASFIIKINEYKTLLSKYGHENMDLLISKIAMNLYDKNDYGFIVGRYCDNKLIVILLNYISDDCIESIKKDVLRGINNKYKILDETIEVSISSGYALYPEDTADLNKLIYYSELAMHRCACGQDSVSFNKNMISKKNYKR